MLDTEYERTVLAKSGELVEEMKNVEAKKEKVGFIKGLLTRVLVPLMDKEEKGKGEDSLLVSLSGEVLEQLRALAQMRNVSELDALKTAIATELHLRTLIEKEGLSLWSRQTDGTFMLVRVSE